MFVFRVWTVVLLMGTLAVASRAVAADNPEAVLPWLEQVIAVEEATGEPRRMAVAALLLDRHPSLQGEKGEGPWTRRQEVLVDQVLQRGGEDERSLWMLALLETRTPLAKEWRKDVAKRLTEAASDNAAAWLMAGSLDQAAMGTRFFTHEAGTIRMVARAFLATPPPPHLMAEWEKTLGEGEHLDETVLYSKAIGLGMAQHFPIPREVLDPCRAEENPHPACLPLGRLMALNPDTQLTEMRGLAFWERAARTPEERALALDAKARAQLRGVAWGDLLKSLGPGHVRAWDLVGPFLTGTELEEMAIRDAALEAAGIVVPEKAASPQEGNGPGGQ